MPSLKPLEELASDGGAAVNTLAGWLSRTLFRARPCRQACRRDRLSRRGACASRVTASCCRHARGVEARCMAGMARGRTGRRAAAQGAAGPLPFREHDLLAGQRARRQRQEQRSRSDRAHRCGLSAQSAPAVIINLDDYQSMLFDTRDDRNPPTRSSLRKPRLPPPGFSILSTAARRSR
jgi:hypothetical protein